MNVYDGSSVRRPQCWPRALETERIRTCVVIFTVASATYLVGSATMSVQDDEPLFADPAHSAAMGAGYRTEILAGFVPGADVRLMWQPPGYSWLLAGWYKLVDFGLVEGRALSVMAAATALVTGYLLTRRCASQASAVIAVSSVGLTPWFAGAATTIRPEAATVLCVLASACLVDRYAARPGFPLFIALQAVTTMAVLLHPIGAVAALVVTAHLLTCRRYALAVLGAATSAILAALIWMPFVLPHWDLFIAQMALQGERKPGLDLLALFKSERRLAGYLPLGLSLVLLFSTRGLRRIPIVSVIGLMLAVMAATAGAERYYPIYIVALGVQVPAVAWDSIRINFARKTVLTAVVLVTTATPCAVGLWNSLTIVSDLDRVAGRIAPGARVFMGPGGGGMYFRADPRRVTAYSPVPVQHGVVDAELRSSDVVVVELPVPAEPPAIASFTASAPQVARTTSLGAWRGRGSG